MAEPGVMGNAFGVAHTRRLGKRMKIEHSVLMNEFISFWFETRIDGVLKYETSLDYLEMEWETKEINQPNSVICSGQINKTKGQEDERIEEARIRDVVTAHIEQTLTNQQT